MTFGRKKNKVFSFLKQQSTKKHQNLSKNAVVVLFLRYFQFSWSKRHLFLWERRKKTQVIKGLIIIQLSEYSCILAQKCKFYQKIHQSWKLSNFIFWPKPNIWKMLALYLYQRFKKAIEGIKKCPNIEVWRRLGWLLSKTLFTQTILDKVFWTN